MRPIWKGGISFGLIFIPVKLYSAVQTTQLDLDLLDERDGAPIRYARINEQTGEEVPWRNVAKGYEYSDGNYIVLEKSDFEKAAPNKSKSIDILSFVDKDEIDIKYFEKPYYVEPINADRPYALLLNALKKTNKVGIAEFVLRDNEHLVVLSAEDDILVLNQIRYKDQIRSTKELEIPKDHKLEKSEVDLAITLIDHMTDKFEPKEYKNDYIDELKRLINAKAKHKKFISTEAEPEEPPKKINTLMDQLKVSLKKYKD